MTGIAFESERLFFKEKVLYKSLNIFKQISKKLSTYDEIREILFLLKILFIDNQILFPSIWYTIFGIFTRI